MKTYSGKIVVEETGEEIEGLVVTLSGREATKNKKKEFIQSDVTKSDGSFSINVDGDMGPDVVLEVYKSSKSEEPITTLKPPRKGGRLQIPLSAEKAAECMVSHKALNLRMNALRAFGNREVDPIKYLQAEFTSLKKFQAQAVNLLAKPKISTRKFFVNPNDDSQELKNKAITEGIESIAKESKLTPLARVIKPDDLVIEDLDLSEEITLDDAPGDISDLIKDRSTIGPVLRNPKSDCKNKTYVLSKLTTGSENGETISDNADEAGETSDPTPDSSDNTDTDNSATENSQLDLLEYLFSIFNEDGYVDEVRPTETSLNKDLNTDIAGGPADATAYHDFYSLNIAWENVWTSFVDEKTAEMLRDAYQEAVKVLGGAHAEGGAEDFSEIEDLKEAMRQLRDAVTVRESASYSDVKNNDGTVTRRHVLMPSETEKKGRLERLLEGVEEALKSKYKFDVFEPHSYNFGVLVNYRQRWQPLSYQVGDLVGTIPLAPGQSQKVTKRHIVKRSRAEKEARKSVASRSFERSTTNRADAEIVNKATSSTNFSMSSSTSIKASIEMIQVGASSSRKFSHNQARESSETKKNFHEAVRKAASEYRDEHSIEVSTTRESEAFSETVTELSNPNNELTITYLFYELQRRFHVSEKLHKVTPVILVALDVPSPNEIDEAWLLEHEWIIRRVLLDDIYVDSLDVLAEGLADSEIAAHTLQAVLEGQSKLVQDLKMDVQVRKDAFEDARSKLAKEVGRAANEQGALEDAFEWVFGGTDDAEKQKSKTEAARKVLDWAEEDLGKLTSELRSAANSLQKAARDYLEAVRDLQRRRVAVDRLRLHVKQNILYYMQAVWTHTPPDQLYFELYDIEVVWPKTTGAPTIVNRETITEGIDENGEPIEREVFEYRYPRPSMGEKRALHEIADLDRVLGFKGNYVILPLLKSNAITDVMMQPYRSDGNAVDPDKETGVDPIDLLEKYRCRRNHADISDMIGNNRSLIDPDQIRKNLADFVQNANNIEGEMIIVPSGALYIEALPGKRPLLEDFKLKHREIDAESAKEDVIGKRLENLRWGLRLNEGMRNDPEIDKKIHIETDSGDNTDVNVDT